jgi:alpha-L-arabinofuranosidase
MKEIFLSVNVLAGFNNLMNSSMSKKICFKNCGWLRFFKSIRMGLVVMIVSCNAEVCIHAQANGSELTIDLSKPGHAISPILYNGMLFEEINYGVDGGFYAQLIKNGSFEDNNKLDSWYLVNPGSSHGGLFAQTPEESVQLNSKQIHCLKLDISSVRGGKVGAANSGYWGIRLDNNTTYKVTFFAKKDVSFNGTITVKLESNSGQIFASSGTFRPTTSWQKFTCDLNTSGITKVTGENRFVIYGSSTGSLYFDVVRVMPPTYKNRPNGLRIDMAEMQAALHPKLIRFPGGCDVEHTSVDSGWNWKNTIGPIELRPGMTDQSWGYHNSQQFGLDDMFQLCEDWGAEPIYCTSMSIDDGLVTTTMDQMQPFIMDVLDLIEYANGDPKTTKWGKIRAENGHPASYNLKYVEIGNENGTTKGYHERYALFYSAIKQAYPSMNVIINTELNGQKADLIDEHHGTRPFNFFDSYNRNGPKIVIGEYGEKENETEVGNLTYAIKEAVFLAGIEHNSDIIVCTTFSTLSANVNFVNWYPDLYYNNSVSFFAIPSYYMERMFVENTGDVILPYTHNSSLFVAPSRVNSSGDIIIKVINASEILSSTTVTLIGAPENKKVGGTATILTSCDPSDENSLAHPTKIIPATSKFSVPGHRFIYSFPANSITVIRLHY